LPSSLVRLSVVLVGVAALSQVGFTGSGCNQPSGPPEPDECVDPRGDAAIATLELGPPGDGAFVPWQDGDQVSIAYGPQGGAMIALRIRATGTGLAECMVQSTHITGNPALSELGFNETPVRWYDDPAGGRATRTAYVILDREPDSATGEPVHIETQVAGVTATRDLVVVP
jgi:hypothetical protein